MINIMENRDSYNYSETEPIEIDSDYEFPYCEVCGETFNEDDLEDGICEKCLKLED